MSDAKKVELATLQRESKRCEERINGLRAARLKSMDEYDARIDTVVRIRDELDADIARLVREQERTAAQKKPTTKKTQGEKP